MGKLTKSEYFTLRKILDYVCEIEDRKIGVTAERHLISQGYLVLHKVKPKPAARKKKFVVPPEN